MAALLGLTGYTEGTHAPRWRQALDRLASRSGPVSNVTIIADFAAACRDPGGAGFAANESWLVMFDGFLDDISVEAGAERTAEHLLKSIQERGIESLYRRAGCFALVAVERHTSTVHLMRDRFGSRPLFYAAAGSGWCWASEIKCLTPLLPATELDRPSLTEIFNYRWLAGPRTLLQGVQQVLPGHVVVLRSDSQPVVNSYWRMPLESRASGTLDAFVEETGNTLFEYLRELARRFPRVGIPLSAGVDSSLLAALASRAGFSECITVSARYPDWDNPELAPAVATAHHLKLEHQIVDVSAAFVAAQFKRLLWRLEEPSRHYHIFPLSRMLDALSSRVDLVLYGEGADTIFGLGAIPRLELFARRQRFLQPIPGPLRHFGGTLARSVGTDRANYLANLLLQTPRSFLFGIGSIKSHTPPAKLVPGLDPEVTPNPETLEAFFQPDSDLASQLQSLNLYTEVKCHLETMDRISASTGMQVAVPFLSGPLIDLAGKVPTSLKARGQISKPILRELGARYFPRDWMYRPKFGFDTPTDAWLRGPLRPFLAALHEPRTLNRGIFRPEVLKKLDVGDDWELLWTAACLETLLRMFVDGEGVD